MRYIAISESVARVIAEVLKVWLISVIDVICSFLHFLIKNTDKLLIRVVVKKKPSAVFASKECANAGVEFMKVKSRVM